MTSEDETVEYIGEMAMQLAEMATAENLKSLRYLLRMAALEAHNIMTQASEQTKSISSPG